MIEFVIFNPGTLLFGFSLNENVMSLMIGFIGIDIHFL
nr:MAG TPA: hypothetical protein [Caudoviricetes sp.]